MAKVSREELRRLGLPEDFYEPGKVLFGARFEHMISFDEFSEVVKGLIEEAGGSWKQSQRFINDYITVENLPALPAGVIMELGLRNNYETKNVDSVEECRKVMKKHIDSLCRQMQEQINGTIDKSQLMKSLFPRVKTWEQLKHSELEVEQAILVQGVEHLKNQVGLVYRSFSSGSGQLQVGLVLSSERTNESGEVERAERWLPQPLLAELNISEDEAFEVAINNLDQVTPKSLRCKFIRSKKDVDRYMKDPHSFHMTTDGPLKSRVVKTKFPDERALSRLLLPRVIESMAEYLECAPTSVVIVPWAEDESFAGCCERFHSMLYLAKLQRIQMYRNPNDTRWNISRRPYRVTNLRNEKGLVELTPYEVFGGPHGLQKWINKKAVAMYPVPKTDQEIEAIERADENRPSRVLLLDESVFLFKHCWQCRKEGSALMMCGGCKKAKYCSRDCQKAHWKAGHRDECEARNKYWTQPGMTKTTKEERKKRMKAAKELNESMDREKEAENSRVLHLP